ncbi:C40 family peptidase [Paenibacillus beijingensis]|uniref:Hydrolase n=1 Tax=Paenibacillus beijingensis TaxID=1126833 RepID=A0A0D5NF84_9BACL|nr:C40 family peptidase [Paenibacillus beijingensis]AJY73911.1 hydrolase [Paenibacillus beijingensis]
MLKKRAAVLLLGATMLFAGAGNAFANESELNETVNEVVGTPYKWGGTTVQGFDCSGFIRYVFNQFETKLPRTSRSQAKVGMKVEKEELRPGDLVFFNTNGIGISHAGIYIGEGKFAHSSSSKGVSISKLSDSYYKKRYVTARRIVTGEHYAAMIEDIHESDDARA